MRFAEAHGQMDESELEATMLAFLRGDADCLVATTIIESGLDIPQANTLIVERADQLGLAQAYQIRGRVGRSRERAFAYMLYPSEEALSPEAGARLATLSDHTELGSGFAIAMRDLELRGAGNLLGDEQSGHVAAIGFELYVALLDEAVEELRAGGRGRAAARRPVRLDVDVDAYLPADYIPFEAAKIDVHRRIAGARRAGRAASAPRRAARPLRPGARAGREPARAPARADRARSAGGPGTAEFRGGRLSVDPARAGRGGRRAPARADSGGDVRVRASRRSRVRVADEPGERLDAVLELAEAVPRRGSRAGRGLARHDAVGFVAMIRHDPTIVSRGVVRGAAAAVASLAGLVPQAWGQDESSPGPFSACSSSCCS